MDWDIVQAVFTGLTAIGMFVLALQKQRVERPLIEAQTSAAAMTSIERQVAAMAAARNEQDLIIARQNTQLADMRTTIEISKNAHEKEVAALRTEMGAKIDLLNKEIVDLKALLADSRKETTEAKEETVKAEAKKDAAPPESTVPLPFPVTIVPPEPLP